MSATERERLELRRVLRALAQPASVQVALFPSFVCVGDELALDFDEALRAFMRGMPDAPSDDADRAWPGPDSEVGVYGGDALDHFIRATLDASKSAELRALGALDAYLNALSGPQDPSFWDEPERLRTDARWDEIRRLAAVTLEAFEWTNVPPEPSDAVYVQASPHATDDEPEA